MTTSTKGKSVWQTLGIGGVLTLVLGVLMTVATVMLGITVPQIWAMSRDLGALEAGQASLKEAVSDLSGSVQRGFATTNTTLASLITRLNEQVTDPKELLAKAGVPISKEYTVYVMGDDFLVFPTTEGALQKMIDAGHETKRITPYLEGFVIPNVAMTPAKPVSPQSQP